jgi:hypothetical protein
MSRMPRLYRGRREKPPADHRIIATQFPREDKGVLPRLESLFAIPRLLVRLGRGQK